MKKFPIETGSIVISTAGRDEGKRQLVIRELDADFVLVADGDTRSILKPKKKRRKHIKPTGTIISELRERAETGASTEDHEIRKWLKKEEEH